MRIGSGVQSVSELFGKRQNNSKTSVNGNEAFPQTSMKVYLKTDDMLFSGGNGTGLSFYIKYAEESTDDNPVVIAKGIDENGKEFEEKININDIDLRNASYVEMSALEAYYDVDRGNSLSLFLTVSKNKIAAMPENIGVVAILTVVLNYSILFPSFTFFLDGFHLAFGDKFEICIKTTDLM